MIAMLDGAPIPPPPMGSLPHGGIESFFFFMLGYLLLVMMVLLSLPEWAEPVRRMMFGRKKES